MKNRILMTINGAAIMGFVVGLLHQLVTRDVWSLVLFLVCGAWLFMFHSLNDVEEYIRGNRKNAYVVVRSIPRNEMARACETHASKPGYCDISVHENET